MSYPIFTGSVETHRDKSAFTDLFHARKWAAKNKGLAWKLTKAEFKVLVDGPCHYCGAPPQQVHRAIRRKGTCRYAYTYNGVDRVDSGIGYLSGNCVTCCWMCNNAKSRQSAEFFKAWIVRAYNHMLIQQ